MQVARDLGRPLGGRLTMALALRCRPRRGLSKSRRLGWRSWPFVGRARLFAPSLNHCRRSGAGTDAKDCDLDRVGQRQKDRRPDPTRLAARDMRLIMLIGRVFAAVGADYRQSAVWQNVFGELRGGQGATRDARFLIGEASKQKCDRADHPHEPLCQSRTDDTHLRLCSSRWQEALRQFPANLNAAIGRQVLSGGPQIAWLAPLDAVIVGELRRMLPRADDEFLHEELGERRHRKRVSPPKPLGVGRQPVRPFHPRAAHP